MRKNIILASAVIAVMTIGIMTGCGIDNDTATKQDTGLKEIKVVKEVSYNYNPPAPDFQYIHDDSLEDHLHKYHNELKPEEFQFKAEFENKTEKSESNFNFTHEVENTETTVETTETTVETTETTVEVPETASAPEETSEVTKNDVLPESIPIITEVSADADEILEDVDDPTVEDIKARLEEEVNNIINSDKELDNETVNKLEEIKNHIKEIQDNKQELENLESDLEDINVEVDPIVSTAIVSEDTVELNEGIEG